MEIVLLHIIISCPVNILATCVVLLYCRYSAAAAGYDGSLFVAYKITLLQNSGVRSFHDVGLHAHVYISSVFIIIIFVTSDHNWLLLPITIV
jgi:hypothetical protein